MDGGREVNMETKVLRGHEAIALGAQLIANGEIVAFPTETVYGLGANAFDEVAVKKIFEAKGRPQDNPLIVHVSCKEDIYPLVDNVDERCEKLIDAFMPGPITIIMKKKDCIPDSVTAGLGNVGIRMPLDKTAREFIHACGCPIAAPSANRSTRISPTLAEHVFEDMDGRIPLIIDGGDSTVGIESTIVDMTRETPTILRPGAITLEMLEGVLGKVSAFKQKSEIKIALAPGMKYKHYAPKCDMVIVTDCDKIGEIYDNNVDKDPIIICRRATRYGNRRAIELGESDEEVCRNIYGALHTGEQIAGYIISEDFEDEGIGGSVMNRLNKASGGHKI